MELNPIDRRREPRYPIDAKVIVQKYDGEVIPASATNISNSGMRLYVKPPSQLKLGEEVTIAVELPDLPDNPFSTWGVGKVVHIDGSYFGMELVAGIFQSEDELLKVGIV